MPSDHGAVGRCCDPGTGSSLPKGRGRCASVLVVARSTCSSEGVQRRSNALLGGAEVEEAGASIVT